MDNQGEGAQPLVSQAIADVIANSFQYRMDYGKKTWPLGTDPDIYGEARELNADVVVKAAEAQCVTLADLLLAQVTDTLCHTDTEAVRQGLVYIASLCIDHIELIDEGVCK